MRDVMRSKEEVNQEREHERNYQIYAISDVSNGTGDLKSAWTHTLSFWHTFESTGSKERTKKIM